MPNSVWKFINYWYLRYLLVTELYMVEKWERVMIHIVFFILFSLLSIFNSYAILGLVGFIFAPTLSNQSLPQPILGLDISAVKHPSFI